MTSQKQVMRPCEEVNCNLHTRKERRLVIGLTAMMGAIIIGEPQKGLEGGGGCCGFVVLSSLLRGF